jgi:hypothetical protein
MANFVYVKKNAPKLPLEFRNLAAYIAGFVNNGFCFRVNFRMVNAQ